MVYMNIQKLLDEKKKTRYWLVQKLESNYETVNRLCDNTSKAVYLDTIGKLCNIFECEPNDLFTINRE